MLWNRTWRSSGFRFPAPDPDNNVFSTVFQQKNCTKSCLFNVRSSTVSRKVGLSFLIFAFHFMLDPDPKPVPEPDPECIPVPEPDAEYIPVPLRQKVPVPVRQHCLVSIRDQ